jgi:hypothetical protein
LFFPNFPGNPWINYSNPNCTVRIPNVWGVGTGTLPLLMPQPI